MPTYRSVSTTRLSADIATVECHKQVRSWRLLRAIMELLIPTCNRTFIQESDNNYNQTTNYYKPKKNINPTTYSPTFSSSNILTGTIFGQKKGKVKFCIQSRTLSGSATTMNPILLLELAIPTTLLAREMQGGLRIALECSSSNSIISSNNDCSSSSKLLEMPVWRMYCNGRRVGFAVKRRPSKADMEVLGRMNNVVVGAGVVSAKEVGCEDDDIIYMRGNFERVRGSLDAESFHLIDPNGNINQDLSIFFLRSR